MPQSKHYPMVVYCLLCVSRFIFSKANVRGYMAVLGMPESMPKEGLVLPFKSWDSLRPFLRIIAHKLHVLRCWHLSLETSTLCAHALLSVICLAWVKRSRLCRRMPWASSCRSQASTPSLSKARIPNPIIIDRPHVYPAKNGWLDGLAINIISHRPANDQQAITTITKHRHLDMHPHFVTGKLTMVIGLDTLK